MQPTRKIIAMLLSGLVSAAAFALAPMPAMTARLSPTRSARSPARSTGTLQLRAVSTVAVAQRPRRHLSKRLHPLKMMSRMLHDAMVQQESRRDASARASQESAMDDTLQVMMVELVRQEDMISPDTVRSLESIKRASERNLECHFSDDCECS